MLRLWSIIFCFWGLILVAQTNEETFVEAEGIGKPPEGKSPAQQKLLARRASQIIALRNLKEALLTLAQVEEKDFPGIEMFMTLYTMKEPLLLENGDYSTQVSLSKRQVLAHYRGLWDEFMQQKTENEVLLEQQTLLQQQVQHLKQQKEEQEKEWQGQLELLLQKKQIEVLQWRKEQDAQKEELLAQIANLNEKLQIQQLKSSEDKKRFEDAYVSKQQEIELLQKQLEDQKRQYDEEIFRSKKEFELKMEELRVQQTSPNLPESFDSLVFELQELNGVVRNLQIHLEKLNKDVEQLKENHK